ncbi:MAG: hypothetical protein PGN09_07745 [Sphingomonas fennica]
MLPIPPAPLLSAPRSPPPADDSGAAYAEAYLAAKAALEAAGLKLAGWATLWRCTATALAAGKPAGGCTMEADQAAGR